mgnify:CR=1 FL=1
MAALVLAVATAVTLPLEFDTDPGWRARPTFLGNPAERYKVVVANDTCTLLVSEPGRGMKFELPIVPFDADIFRFLVLRYRAQNLGSGYAIWLMDQRPGGGQVLGCSELVQDLSLIHI